MTANEVKIGSEYVMKVSGRICRVRVLSDRILANGRQGYNVINLRTNRKLVLRSAARLHPLPSPLSFYLDVTQETLEATANIGMFVPCDSSIRHLNLTKELTREEAVNLVHRVLGVGNWLVNLSQARMPGGLHLPGFGTFRACSN